MAVNCGKRLLLFVEDGVDEIGGLQGDYEYVRFDRSNLVPAILKAMDYVLSITNILVECHVDPINRRVDFKVALGKIEWGPQLAQLRRLKTKEPQNPQVRLDLAKVLEHSGDRPGAMVELQEAIRLQPHFADAHHELAHMEERNNNLEAALSLFQRALDLNNSAHKHYLCYGKCLYQKAKSITDLTVRAATLDKARRMIEQSVLIGGEPVRAEASRQMFLVEEAMDDIGCQCPPVEPGDIEPPAGKDSAGQE
jgi:tetratricopeptide (TPR) repeat protein